MSSLILPVESVAPGILSASVPLTINIMFFWRNFVQAVLSYDHIYILIVDSVMLSFHYWFIDV